MAARSRGTGPPPLATVHSVHFHTLIIRGRVARISCKFPWKCPLREGRGNKKKRRKREREINIALLPTLLSPRNRSPYAGRASKGSREKGGDLEIHICWTNHPLPHTIWLETWTLEKNDIYLFIYIFFFIRPSWRIFDAPFIYFPRENSIIPWNLHEWKKGGRGEGGCCACTKYNL